MQTKTGLAPVNGAQLYYEIAGQGQPLLLIHAGVADCRQWDEQFSAFAQQFRVIRFDLRGFGRSAMPAGVFSNHQDVAGLLDYFQMNQAIVVGTSFGGKIALDFALTYPQRVAALVLGAPSVGGSKPSRRILEFWEAEEAAIEREDWDLAVELNLRLWVDGPQRQPAKVNSAVRQKVGQMQREIFLMPLPEDVEEVGLPAPAAGRLAEITSPTLILVGALDLPEKVTQAAWLADNLPDAQQGTMPGVAHMLNMEAPAEFNQLVLDFLSHDLSIDTG